MKAIKTISVLTIILCLSQCGVSKFDATPPFIVKEVKQSTWVGGLPGVRGTKIEIDIVNNSSIIFKSLYYQNRITGIEKVILNEKTTLIANYNTSKVINDKVLDLDPKKEITNQLPKAKSFPFKLKKNEAVLSYLEKGKTKFFKIKDITINN